MRTTRHAAASTMLVACALVAVACGTPEISQDDAARAEELQTEWSSTGTSIPTSTAALLFDGDGGHLCAAAGSAGDLANVALVGHRFALRKTAVSPDDVARARAVITVYCPDKLSTFDDYAAGLVTGETSDD